MSESAGLDSALVKLGCLAPAKCPRCRRTSSPSAAMSSPWSGSWHGASLARVTLCLVPRARLYALSHLVLLGSFAGALLRRQSGSEACLR